MSSLDLDQIDRDAFDEMAPRGLPLGHQSADPGAKIAQPVSPDAGQCSTVQCSSMEKAAQTTIRMTPAERDAWEEAARRDGRTLSAWIVRRCNGEPTTAPVLPATTAAKPKRRGR